MALRKTEKNSCYWCCNSSNKQKSHDKLIAGSSSSTTTTSSSNTAEMEVDVENLNAALHELGMLSAITESRKQYLKEITTAGSSHNKTASEVVGKGIQKGYEQSGGRDVATAGFCVVHMNSDYIRNFHGSWDYDQESLNLKGPTSRGASLTFKKDACCSREDRSVIRPRLHRCLHFHKPYSIPCDAKVRRRGWSWWSRNQDSESSSKSSRDSGLGNRSNPGSPEKGSCGGGGATPELLPNGLVRSRSLDDIETIQQIPEPESESSPGVIVPPLYDFLSTSATVSPRNELESVSQRMEHLHVN